MRSMTEVVWVWEGCTVSGPGQQVPPLGWSRWPGGTPDRGRQRGQLVVGHHTSFCRPMDPRVSVEGAAAQDRTSLSWGTQNEVEMLGPLGMRFS